MHVNKLSSFNVKISRENTKSVSKNQDFNKDTVNVFHVGNNYFLNVHLYYFNNVTF